MNLQSFKKFFSTGEEDKPVMEAPIQVKGTKEIIEQIHNEFNNKGDELVKEAQSIIDGISIHNEEKSKRLVSIGFRQTREVVDYSGKIAAKEQQKKLTEALTSLQTEFPQYKFITTEAAMAICEKYNLVLGDIGQYTGFVPEKNLKQIEDFFSTKNELNLSYYLRKHSFQGNQRISKKEYEMYSGELQLLRERNAHHSIYYNVYQAVTELRIAAPLKDMKAEGYKLKGKVFEKEIPDPVVLAPVNRNGVDLFCIITAWGDEASDELVVNQQMN